MPGLPGYDGLPGIDELTAREDGPERGPDELSTRVRAFMGEADAPPAQRAQDAPDTAALRQELGL
jgi:hypothetical protein